jgi:DHA1 family bicyclomycin/chloramphenicol resistance-like MFS transporter
VTQAVSLGEEERIEPDEIPLERKIAPVPFISFGFALALVCGTIWANDLVSPALPEIKDDFGLSAKGMGLIVSFLFVGRLLGNVPAMRFLESVGAPRTGSIGGFVLVAGSVTNALAPNPEVLYLGRLLQGLGISLLVNAGMRSILFARPGRGDAMTIYGIASTSGSVLGLVSSGLLTGAFGWRAVFALAAALGVVLTLLPMANTRAARRTTQAAPSVPVAAISVPLRTYLVPLAVNFLIFCNYSVWTILPLYAEHRFDAGPGMTANLLLIITIMHLAAAVPVRGAIRRFGSSTVLAGSVVVALIGSMGILLAPSVWALALPLMFYGAGMVGSVNCAGDIVLHRGGAGSKAVGTLRQTSDLGLVVGPLAAGSMIDAISYSAPFIAFPILMVAAALGVQLSTWRSFRNSEEVG